MRPSSMGSSRFTVRSSVDLPEPLAPMRATTSPCSDLEVDAHQHVVIAERLPDVLEPQHGLGGGHTIPPICSRARTRAVYQSVRRMVGIASRTNSRAATT